MKLKNEMYSIVRKEVAAQKICYYLSLNAQHVIFQAHFPEEPITPGVCIIQIACELLENHLQHRLVLKKIKNVKFLSVISPVNTPEITYTLERIEKLSEQNIKTNITVGIPDKTFAKISFIVNKC